jgi:hypothetical protein
VSSEDGLFGLAIAVQLLTLGALPCLSRARSRPLYNRVEFGRIPWTVRRREASSEDSPGHVDELKHIFVAR